MSPTHNAAASILGVRNILQLGEPSALMGKCTRDIVYITVSKATFQPGRSTQGRCSDGSGSARPGASLEGLIE